MADYTPKHLADKILQSKSALEGERKQVTVLFADIQGSMELAARLDPERWHRLLERYFGILTEAVHRFEGTVNQYTGDGIMALFGAPIAHEDHAQRAGYAALQARDRLLEFAAELRRSEGLGISCRIGLNTGDVVVGRIGDDLRMDYTAQGATVGIAQRIEQLAAGGQICLSGVTARIADGFFELRALGEIPLKGIAEPVPVYVLEGASHARTRLDVAITRGLSRFVGRTQEMEILEAALARTRAGHGQVIGIVGDPGLGKSRLCLEFVARCRAAGLPVYEARCPAHGRNIPYLPILDLFRNYFGIDPQDDAAAARRKIGDALLALDATLSESLPVLFEFMGVGTADMPAPVLDAEVKQRQLYDLMHRVVRAQDARGQVSVTLIDDLHWIDAGSDAFVNQLVNAVAGRRGLLVLNFRPEYVAAFASRPHYQQLPLVPLEDTSGRELVASLIGTDPSVGALTERVVDWTTGNPFYTEELVNSLIETGVLAGTPGAYRLTTALERLTVPDNVRSVLAARIDRLPDAAKRLLQTAAVIGREFSAPILDAVIDLSPADVAMALERLKSGDFVFERALYPVFEYAFKHPLTHEVAYQSLLQSRRATVHAAVANALEEHAGDRLDEQAALLAHHCEEAGQLMEAARWHRRAAEWVGVNDITTGLRHWQRVRELAHQFREMPDSASLIVTSCVQALAHGWRLGASASQWTELFADGCVTAESVDDLASLSMLHATYSAALGLNQGSAPDYVRYSGIAVEISDRVGDSALRCATRLFQFLAQAWSGHVRESERICDEVIGISKSDVRLGVSLTGISPFVAATSVRAFCIGMNRDPDMAMLGLSESRQMALENDYPEMVFWTYSFEAIMRGLLGKREGARALATDAIRLAEKLGPGNSAIAEMALCAALSSEHEWQTLLVAATAALQKSRERGALRLVESIFLGYIGAARLGLGDPIGGREAANEGVLFTRATKSALNPHTYAVLARAQLALSEPVDDIKSTLDEYADLIDTTGLGILEGELYELRARLAKAAGSKAQVETSILRSKACYTRFGMTEHASKLVNIDSV